MANVVSGGDCTVAVIYAVAVLCVSIIAVVATVVL